MKISAAVVVALHAIFPSSLSYSPPQYRGLFSLRPVRGELSKQKCAFHRPQITPSTSAQNGAKLTKEAFRTALDVSSASPGEEKILDEENKKNVADMNELLETLSQSLDRWIVTGSMASRRRSYDIIKKIEKESKDDEVAKQAVRMATRASMPLAAPPPEVDSIEKQGQNNGEEKKSTAWERKKWEEERSSSTSNNNIKRPVGVHLQTGKRSALSKRISDNSSKQQVDTRISAQVHADSKKELEEELARVVPDDSDEEDISTSKNMPPPPPPFNVVEAAEAKTSELVATAGSGMAFDGDALGIGGLDNVLSQIKRRIWVPLAAPPSLLKELGINPVRGLLLYGAPGCGKTLLARSLGKILSPTRPITVVSGPEVMDRFVGSSEANLREIFDTPPDIYDTYRIDAKDGGAAIASAALHVIILDEFDAMARARGGSGGKGDQGDAGVARDSVVNQLLAKMDGVDDLVVPTLVIGLTNKRSLIEPALLRPGRFEVQIEVPKPTTVSQRVSILNVHMNNMYAAGRVLVSDAPDGTPAAHKLKNMDEQVLMSYNELVTYIATECDGMSGASLAGVARAAASRALERSVCDFAGWINQGNEETGEESSIADCIVTELDFKSAVEDIMESNEGGDGGEDKADDTAK